MESKSSPVVVTIGDINIDWIIKVEDIDMPIQSLWLEAKECISTKIGGGGFIFAAAAKDAGFKSFLIGKVGDDPFGSFATEFLKQNGIISLISVDRHKDTGKVVILRDTKDRKLMISHRGANVSLTSDNINDEVIKESDLLYISGYALLESPQSKASLHALRIAKNNKVFIVLDVVPHRIFTTKPGDDYFESLSSIDAIILELGTARRLLNNMKASENGILDNLLESYKLVILRPNNDTQIIADLSRRTTVSTGYSQAENKVGYLDKITAKLMFDYIMERFKKPATVDNIS